MRKTLGIYLVDQDRKTTSSLGILNYSVRLVRGLAEAGDPRFEVALWLSEANLGDFGTAFPSWMRMRCLRGSYGRGVRRLWADHVAGPHLARSDGVAAVHYPKGWLPSIMPPRIKTIATVHDTIVQHYLRDYPGFFPRAKLAYFDWATRRALRQADRVITGSRLSARELAALVPGSERKIRVIPTGGMEEDDPPAGGAREGILVLGSRLPHKATAETLRLLDSYAREKGESLEVAVAGLSGWEELGQEPPAAPAARVNFLERIPTQELKDRMRKSRALVFLSEIEGFGLPVLEAYSGNTPVCYRMTSAVAEVLEGVPGGWDGRGADTFFRALDEALDLTPVQVDAIRRKLAVRYNWKEVVRQTLGIYQECLT